MDLASQKMRSEKNRTRINIVNDIINIRRKNNDIDEVNQVIPMSRDIMAKR